MPFQRFRPFAASRGCRSLATLGIPVLLLVLCALGAGLLAYRTLAPLSQSAGASAPPTGTAPAGTFTPTSVPGYRPQTEDELNSVVMVSRSEGWAVGSTYVSGQIYEPLILHYTGSRWERRMDLGNTDLQARTSGLEQVAMVSASEGWAVGNLELATARSDGTTDGAFILHYH